MGLFSFLSPKATPAEYAELLQRILDLYRPSSGDSEYIADCKSRRIVALERGKSEAKALDDYPKKSEIEQIFNAEMSTFNGIYESNKKMIGLALEGLKHGHGLKDIALDLLKLNNDEDETDSYEKMLEAAEIQIKKYEAELKKYGYSA